MSLRSRPDPDDFVQSLAGRVDALGVQVRRDSTDVTVLGRAVADLTNQIRALTASVTPTSLGSATPAVAEGDGQENEDEDEVPAGQPDWFTVDDPGAAAAILTGITIWVERIGAHHGIVLPVVCWPLHPEVVAELLALTEERQNAYTEPKPTPVSEWLTRWLPETTTRITAALAQCKAERGHRADGRTYDTTGLDLVAVALWWTTDRDTPAPAAFALLDVT